MKPGATKFVVVPEQEGATVAAALRIVRPGLSWSEARRHIHARRVRVNGVVCVDDVRRLRAGDAMEFLEQSARPLPSAQQVEIMYEDDAVLVVEKPAGMECERRSEQRNWSKEKRERQPTLVESLEQKGGEVFAVHRLDRDTSGLMVYARTSAAQQALIAQFAGHTIGRKYRAVAIGRVQPQTVRSWLVRDRGDGVRGSGAPEAESAEEAITHFAVLEYLLDEKYTLLDCRLETGKTHQIRIHLAEMGHPICGEKIYLKPTVGSEPIVDESGAPRQALHAYALEFAHPEMQRVVEFESPWPADLKRWMEKLRPLQVGASRSKP